MTSSSESGPGRPQPNGAASRHPRGLYVLFFTEMWERFSFYGTLPLLVLYLGGPFHFTKPHVASIIGLYTALVYTTPIVGGFLADRVIGYRAAVLGGAVLLMAGDFLLGVPRLAVVYLALALLLLGNGGFKPNISTIVGKLYAPGDSRRDRGFTIFYMGINIGAIAAPLVCGYMRVKFGWAWGFATAGLGLVVACLVFSIGGRAFAGVNLHPHRARRDGVAHEPLTAAELRRLALLGVVLLFVIVFWIGYAQGYLSLLWWFKDNTFRPVLPHWLGGQPIPPEWSQSIEPLWVVALAAPMSALWAYLSRRGREPSSPAKMALGLVVFGLAFVVMAVGAVLTGGRNASMAWIIVFFFIMPIGELALSPVGLSFVTQIAPPRFAGALMGIWFVDSAVGMWLGGELAKLWGCISHPTYFAACAALCVVTGLLLAATLPALRRMTATEEAA